ncbi:BglG family transcription antiterminator [Planctomonas psychrotolerans]|uniref:BglG family transcription antiterminator n=1 Tax=Planctomonas psychrotolerans TaxID=2528712 RepID=UPI0029D41DA8|nr:PTS sugar transporter subunit IIA [Planctomonas psychrotolerans]
MLRQRSGCAPQPQYGWKVIDWALEGAPTERPHDPTPGLEPPEGCTVLSESHERLLDYLSMTERWVDAGELAAHLGVTTRSVRNYVNTVRSRTTPLVAIESSSDGYRLDRGSYAAYRKAVRSRGAEAETPRDRIYSLVRQLGNAPSGLDVHDLADAHFVSESTIEADLRRIRGLVEGADLGLTRTGSTVSLTGSEHDFRRLLSRMFREERVQDFFELENVQREFSVPGLGAFKTDLLEMLERNGYFVNEFGTDNVLLHVAIAVDRASRERALEEHPLPSGVGFGESATGDPSGVPDVPDRSTVLAEGLSELTRRHFGVDLGRANIDYLTLLLTTRVVTPGNDEALATVLRDHVASSDLDTVRAIVRRVQQEYLVDLDDDAFTARFSLHLGNLVARARNRSLARNPLARSIKTTYPMTFEVAVFIASEISRRKAIVLNDDEIAYIALHVGSHLERSSHRQQRVTCAIVCANYYDLQDLLRRRIESELGSELSIELVVTRTDIDPQTLPVDLVLSAAVSRPGGNVVPIHPIPTTDDIDAIRAAITRVRRHNRRAAIKDDLLRFFDEELFFRNLDAPDEESMIRALGKRMVERGVIDQSYIEGAIARERMSSTAFTDSLAVPHAMEMTAERTSIAIAVNEVPMPWGGSRVNVVALIAFSASGRGSFQRVFDQFVEVFSDRADVLGIIDKSADFASFIEQLVHVIDA